MKKFLFWLILWWLLVFWYFFIKENPDNSIVIQSKNLVNKVFKKQSIVWLANPASAYCIEQNWQLSIQNGEGGQIWICAFPDWSCCEEWEFFRWECQKSTQYCNDFWSIITNNNETNTYNNTEVDEENPEDIDENPNSEDNKLDQTEEYEETEEHEEIIQIEDEGKTEETGPTENKINNDEEEINNQEI